jgi:hypothetical protein
MLQPHLTDRRYTNFMSADDAGFVRQGYGANYERLAQVKRDCDCDPDNFFRLNHNIEAVA